MLYENRNRLECYANDEFKHDEALQTLEDLKSNCTKYHQQNSDSSEQNKDTHIDTGDTVQKIGGYDGESFSNTLFFEKIRNWNGLLVEASPFLYDIMLKKDRKCYMVNACISTSLPTMTFVLAGGITSAKETLTDMHRRRIARDRITYGKYANWANTNDTAKVTCVPLLRLLKTLGALISITFL
ncbi:unnamed protein product [Mytilus edulis]|uniref:Uncharacterized protein n=1 Tax=Mytilus edulis TaxID=6550 RepID=A0A8S3SUR6_MYTED|nr:unnamed protein product [Mytilus edulis]